METSFVDEPVLAETETDDELARSLKSYRKSVAFWKAHRDETLFNLVYEFHKGGDDVGGKRQNAFLFDLNKARGWSRKKWIYASSRNSHIVRDESGLSEDEWLALTWGRVVAGAGAVRVWKDGSETSLWLLFACRFGAWVEKNDPDLRYSRRDLKRAYLAMLANSLSGWKAEWDVVQQLRVLCPGVDVKFADDSFEEKDVDVLFGGLMLSVKSGSSLHWSEFDRYRKMSRQKCSPVAYVGFKSGRLRVFEVVSSSDPAHRWDYVEGGVDRLREMLAERS